VPTYTDVRAIVTAARRVRQDVPIIARADGADAVRELYGMGIEDVTSPEFEAAVEMAREALVRFERPAEEIQRVTNSMRRAAYLWLD
jgi:CPA2 family monovalent cation:H+ antiporter-2